MRPIVVVVGPLATASANNIALSQTPGGAGNLTLNGSTVTAGRAVLPQARRVLITTTDTTTVFTINGTTATGSPRTETLIVSGGSSYTQLDYHFVTSISVNQATTAAVTVGTNGVANTTWVYTDPYADAQIGFQCTVSGTVNYTVQSTFDDPDSPTNPVAPALVTWITTNDTNMVGATTSLQSNFLFAPTYIRVLLNSGSGSVTMTVVQYNVVSR